MPVAAAARQKIWVPHPCDFFLSHAWVTMKPNRPLHWEQLDPPQARWVQK